MPFHILEKPISYSTFQTKSELSTKLLRCSRCRCAWYSSPEDQRSNWPVHKEVCRRPEYDIIAKYSVRQCMKILNKHTRVDHNTAAIFERLFDLMRGAADADSSSVQGEDLSDLGFNLHSLARMQSSYHKPDEDYLESFYRRAWACPGIPQLLYFTDLRCAALRKMMTKFPKGRPTFDDEDEQMDFDMKFDVDSDTSGEEVAWFIVGFLVRSCVFGSLSMSSNHDGRGNLRTTNFSAGALKRVTQIFVNKLTHESAKKALYPLPGLVLTVAEQKPAQFLQMLKSGVGPNVMRWADQEYANKTLSIMATLNMGGLSDHPKLDLLEKCLNVFGRYPSIPWYSTDDTDDKKLFKLCVAIAVSLLSSSTDVKGLLETGMKRRPEKLKPDWRANDNGESRMVIAFLYDKLTSDVDIMTIDTLTASLDQWRELHLWEKMKYAEKVMEVDRLRVYDKKAEDLRKWIQEDAKNKS